MATPAPELNADPALNVPITPELIEKHGLSAEEYQLVLKILGREPNLTELGIFGVMWSEHCSYKNSRPLLKGFPIDRKDPSAPNQVLVHAGEENAGVIDIGGGWSVCFKIESHNHPSAVEPFQGAATGIGGILRDIYTMGARPVLFTNSLRFGELDSKNTQRLLRGVVQGIAHYGNCVGIPTVAGDVVFDDCYEGSPLVNALCLGQLRNNEIKRGAASGVGNPVYYVGAATGRDGLGGASFASKELSDESAEDRPAVQKGDPFMGKLLMEACLELMHTEGIVVGIQDMGAAGLTCSTCETAARGDTGIEIELDLVPQRETNMNSYEIMLSESQERFLVIAKKGREKDVERIFEKWDLHAALIGRVTDGKDMVVKQGGKIVAQIPAKMLADDAPTYLREAKRPAYMDEVQAWTADSLPKANADFLEDSLKKVLSHPTVASKQWIYRQFDHMVMSSTVLHPGAADAGVIRLRTDGEDRYIAIANDCNNRFCWADPYRGAQIAIAECVRNLACTGARTLAMTNNLNFGNPNKPESYYLLKESIKGLADACQFFDAPVVGGNVSLYNETPDSKIDPTPVVSLLGVIDDKAHITGSTLKTGTEHLILLGGAPHELGQTTYLKVIHGLKTGPAPELDLPAQQKLVDVLLGEIRKGHVVAAHDISDGGLLTTLAEMLFAEKVTFGAAVDLSALGNNQRADALLYGESQGRVVIAVKDAETAEKALAAAKEAGLPAAHIGQALTESSLTVSMSGLDRPLTWDVVPLRRVWQNTIGEVMAI